MTPFRLVIITRATHTAWRVRIGATDTTITRNAGGVWCAESGPWRGRELGPTQRAAVRVLRTLATTYHPELPC